MPTIIQGPRVPSVVVPPAPPPARSDGGIGEFLALLQILNNQNLSERRLDLEESTSNFRLKLEQQAAEDIAAHRANMAELERRQLEIAERTSGIQEGNALIERGRFLTESSRGNLENVLRQSLNQAENEVEIQLEQGEGLVSSFIPKIRNVTRKPSTDLDSFLREDFPGMIQSVLDESENPIQLQSALDEITRSFSNLSAERFDENPELFERLGTDLSELRQDVFRRSNRFQDTILQEVRTEANNRVLSLTNDFAVNLSQAADTGNPRFLTGAISEFRDRSLNVEPVDVRERIRSIQENQGEGGLSFSPVFEDVPDNPFLQEALQVQEERDRQNKKAGKEIVQQLEAGDLLGAGANLLGLLGRKTANLGAASSRGIGQFILQGGTLAPRTQDPLHIPTLPDAPSPLPQGEPSTFRAPPGLNFFRAIQEAQNNEDLLIPQGEPPAFLAPPGLNFFRAIQEAQNNEDLLIPQGESSTVRVPPGLNLFRAIREVQNEEDLLNRLFQE